MAITKDFEAVVVDTRTGEILHEIGHTGTSDDFDSGQEIAPNVLVEAWRSSDGEYYALVDCCEPAGGVIMYVRAGGSLPPDRASGTDGWTLSPSPVSGLFARIGYDLGVFDPDDFRDDHARVRIDEPELGFPTGSVAWRRDGRGLYWIGNDFGTGTIYLNSLDLSEDDPRPVAEAIVTFVGSGQWLGGLATQASGNLVSFRHTGTADRDTATEGVVFNPSGELLGTFPVEIGSIFGSYDISGKFLIYVDEDGAVRWQGRGESGLLANGFVHATW